MKNRKLALKDKTDRYFQDNLKEFERSLRIYKKTLKRYILTKLYY